jgi:hypothetical protein
VAIETIQRVEDWFEERRQFRKAALLALRKRENLPSPVDADGNPLDTRFDDLGNAHYYNAAGEMVDHVLWAGAGRDGKPGAFATGKRKGEAREIADASWHRPDAEFEILEVSEDGRKLEDELRDLSRDAAGMELAERVRHEGDASEQAPGLELSGTTDGEVDEKLQQYLKRGQ